jgi:hypothetical protein
MNNKNKLKSLRINLLDYIYKVWLLLQKNYWKPFSKNWNKK